MTAKMIQSSIITTLLLFSIFTNFALVNAQLSPARDLTGTWMGTAEWSDTFDYYPAKVTCNFASAFALVLNQNGNTLTGNIEYDKIVLKSSNNNQACMVGLKAPIGPIMDGIVSSSSFSGGVQGGTIDGSFTTDLMSGTIKGSSPFGVYNLSFKTQRQSAPTTIVPITPITPTPNIPDTSTSTTVAGYVRVDSPQYVVSQGHSTQVKIIGKVNDGRGDTITLTIKKPDGTIDENHAILTNTHDFTLIVMLDKNSPSGPYEIKASYYGTVFGSDNFDVINNPSSSLPATNQQPTTQKPQSTLVQKNIPSWVRNNAKWWADGSITETDFIKGIQYLIQQGLIVVTPSQGVTNTSQSIPSWVKNTAKWWADGSVNDSDFINAIQYLIKNGIISVPQEASSNVSGNSQNANQQFKTFHNYGFSFEYPVDWIVEDKTTDKNMPHIQIHSSDSSTQVTIGAISNVKEFSGLTGKAYLDALINYYKSKCSSNPACANFNLINSQITPFEGASLYIVSFETQNTSNQGNVIKYTVTDAEIPTPEGTWIMIAEGPSANYASYSQQMGAMISSMNFDQNTVQSSTGVESNTQSYGGYNSWEDYCQSTYGSNYHYDSPANKCMSYGGYNSKEAYCQGTYGSNYHYDSSTDNCMQSSSGTGSTGSGDKQTGAQKGTLTPARDLTGQWTGTLSGSVTFDYYDQYTKAPTKVVCQFSGPVSFSLIQRGNNLGGNVDSTQVSVTGNSACPSSQALGGVIQATVSSSAFSGNVAGISMTGQFTTDLIQGWLNGNIGEISVTGKFTAQRAG